MQYLHERIRLYEPSLRHVVMADAKGDEVLRNIITHLASLLDMVDAQAELARIASHQTIQTRPIPGVQNPVDGLLVYFTA